MIIWQKEKRQEKKISKFSNTQKQTFNHRLLSWICELSLMNGYSNIKLQFGELLVWSFGQIPKRMNTIDFQFYLQILKLYPAQNINSVFLLDEIGEKPKPNKWPKERKKKQKNKNLDRMLKNEHEEKWNRRAGTLEMVLQQF